MNIPTTPPGEPPLNWRRLHPVTPVLRGWSAMVVFFFLLTWVFGEQAAGDSDLDINIAAYWWTIPLGLFVVLLLSGLAAWVAWRKMAYAISDNELLFKRGIVFKQQRNVRLDRLQTIDVRQPLAARIFGLAELRIEAAGGANSNIVLGFLKDEVARSLRAELLARAAGLRQAPQPQPQEVAPVPANPDDPFAMVTPAVDEAPEQQMLQVPMGRLLGSLLLSPVTWIAIIVLAAIPIIIVATGDWSAVLGIILPLVAVPIYVFGGFASSFNFRVALSPDGIRTRRGLLETRAQTIPPGRVQAISLSQGLLWRKLDWWSVRVNIAGQAATDTQTLTQSVLLPVGKRQDALTALWLVLPELGVDDPLSLLDEGLVGIVARDGTTPPRPDGLPSRYVNAPPRSWIVDPLAWRRDAYAATERAMFMRRGRLIRRLHVVPHEKMQSVQITQGPLQRKLRVATFCVHSTPGMIAPTVPHLDEKDAARLLHEQAARARAARAVAGPEQWMLRLEEITASRTPHPPDG